MSDPSASREHFKIFRKDGVYYLEDLKSLNGTQLNGHLITEVVRLNEGAQITIGETSFTWTEKGPAEKDPLLNQKLAGYLIVKRLGRGGMGTVYLARQLSLQRDVALKILDPQLGKNREFIQQFIEEARASATLNHPNILQVYDVGESEGRYYFSMEYAAGGSIQRLIEGQKKLPVEEAMGYMIATARGLEYAERKKIVHRDIKPDNLMLSEEKVVKIGDLGLAKRLDQEEAREEKGIYGTPYFISPEQAQNLPIDHRADMYSFGASFYRILSGQPPFQGKTMQQIVMKHVLEKPPPLRSIEPSIPQELCDVIEKMMQKDPRKRYASNSDLIEELERVRRKIQRQEKNKAAFQESRAGRRAEQTSGIEKKLSHTGAYRRRQKPAFQMPSVIKTATAAMILAVLGIAFAVYFLYLSPPSPKKSNEKGENSDKTAVLQNANPSNIEQPSLETRYRQLKSSRPFTSDPRPFIVDYQKIVSEAPPGSSVGQEAMQDLHLLLDQEVLEPCKMFIEQKKFERAFQCLEKYEAMFTLPELAAKVAECRTGIEQICKEEVFQIDIECHTYWDDKKYHMISNRLKKIERMRDFCRSSEIREEFTEVTTRWSKRLEPYLSTSEVPDGPEEPDDGGPEEPEVVVAPDEKLLAEYQKILTEALYGFQYGQGAKKMEDLFAALEEKGQVYPQEWKKGQEELEYLADLLKKIGSDIRGDRYSMLGEAVKKEYLRKNPGRADIKVTPLGLKEDKLQVRIQPPNGGSMEYGFPLKDFGALWIYDNLMVGTNQPPKYQVSMALYCYHYRLYRQGWKFCCKAEEENEKSKLLLELKARFKQVEIRGERIYENDLLPCYRELVKRQEELAEDLQNGVDITEAKEEHLENIRQFQKALEEYREQYQHTRFFSRIKQQ